MQEGEGTRAAMFYNLFSDPAYTLDQRRSDQLLARSASGGRRCGLHVGFELLQADICGLGQGHQRAECRRQRDPGHLDEEFQGCMGRCRLLVRSRRRRHGDDVPRDQGSDTDSTASGNPPFTYRPNIDRVGVFGNYLFFDKLDVLGGYHSQPGRLACRTRAARCRTTSANTYRGEADYYIKTGTVIMARFDRGTGNDCSAADRCTRRPGASAANTR